MPVRDASTLLFELPGLLCVVVVVVVVFIRVPDVVVVPVRKLEPLPEPLVVPVFMRVLLSIAL